MGPNQEMKLKGKLMFWTTVLEDKDLVQGFNLSQIVFNWKPPSKAPL